MLRFEVGSRVGEIGLGRDEVRLWSCSGLVYAPADDRL